MSRTLTAAKKTALEAQEIRTALLFKFNFSTSVFFTTWPKNLIHNGDTYTPGVGLISFSPIKETANTTITSIKIGVSGANLSNVAVMLNENYEHVEINIFRVLLDEQYDIIPDPIQHDFYIDTYNYEENPRNGRALLTWKATNHWGDFQGVSGRRTNDSDQQLHYPGDLGFEFSSDGLIDLHWGRI